MPLSLQASLWETVKCDLRGLFPEDVYQMWFAPMVCLAATDEALTLGVPNDFAAIWINDNYLDLISQRLRLNAGRVVNVTLKKVEPTNGNGTSPVRSTAPTPDHETNGRATQRTPATRRPRYDDRGGIASTLNPRNTFENFVVGPNNQLAHAAALAVAQAPAQAYNPLFIHGATGLGKTHLMHAVGHNVLTRNADSRVAYLSTEKFTNEFIHAIQETP
jgi:chromosomal replication initiator protein